MIEEQENELGTEKISKLIRRFSIPCIISLIVSALYNIVDQIFIGQGVGYLGNAATNIVYPMTVIATALALLIGDGTAAYLSLCLGRNDKDSANKGVNNGFIITVLLGVILLIVGVCFQEPLLKLFGVTEKSYAMTKDYMFWIVIGLPFFAITTAMNSVIRADGSPKSAMITMLLGAIINIILDPIAIFVLGLGVKGAAIATIIGQIISAIVTIIFLKRLKNVKLEKKYFKLDFRVIKKLASLGISSFITQVAVTIVIIVMNNLMGKYGALSQYGSEIPLSAMGIVMKVNSILIAIAVGIAAGSQPIIGYNYGAKKYDRVKKTFYTAVKITFCVLIVFFLIFQFCPDIIINIFGQEDELYTEFARMTFRTFLMFCVFSGIQIVISIFFQSIGKPVKSAILSLLRQILLFVPAAIIFANFFGIQGILYSGPIADGISFIVALIFIIFEIKNLNKLEKEELVCE